MLHTFPLEPFKWFLLVGACPSIPIFISNMDSPSPVHLNFRSPLSVLPLFRSLLGLRLLRTFPSDTKIGVSNTPTSCHSDRVRSIFLSINHLHGNSQIFLHSRHHSKSLSHIFHSTFQILLASRRFRISLLLLSLHSSCSNLIPISFLLAGLGNGTSD